MAAIAGLARPNAETIVDNMLIHMEHRGRIGRQVRTVGGVTLGLCWPAGQPQAGSIFENDGKVEDRVSDSHYATAYLQDGELILTRDPLGVAPLYYGYTSNRGLAFASEVKALVNIVEGVHELPPGCSLRKGAIHAHFALRPKEQVSGTYRSIATSLRRCLTQAVEKRASQGVLFGVWLSGGLDSSIMAALARPYAQPLHTFAAGFAGAPDLDYARRVARHIHSNHHEVIPTFDELLYLLPEVIFHLESFDALLVRSSLMNYLVAKRAAEYVPTVFSGEGSDELFAGYSYLKQIEQKDLPDELVDITARLHNTALQRVDRCSAAHGTVAYVGFLDSDVVDYALGIPPEHKIRKGVEKWILRRAVEDLLPEEVLVREKAKFWEGAGVEVILSQHAEASISDHDFSAERQLPNGWLLNTKEELLNYRIFKDHFGELENLSWMGRTKGAPQQDLRVVPGTRMEKNDR